jgi:hypothetical protein
MSPEDREEMAGLRNLVAEVFVQASRDYRKLKACREEKLKMNGATTLVEVELSRIREFFLGGGADAYMGLMDDMDLKGADLWERLTNSKRGEFTSFVAL